MSQFPYRGEQPAWIDGRTADTAIREREFIRSVYAWMFGGLILTALAAWWVVKSEPMQALIFNTPLRWVLLVVELGLVMGNYSLLALLINSFDTDLPPERTEPLLPV